MKLSLFFLLEKAGLISPQTPIVSDFYKSKSVILFSAVRRFSSLTQDMRSDVLYIFDENDYNEEMIQILSDSPYYFLICCKRDEPCHYTIEKKLFWLYGNNLNTSTVLNMFLSIYDEYDEWDEKMKQAVLQEEALQVFLDIASTKLQNPIAVFDTSQTALGFSGSFHGTQQNTIWDGVLENGYSSVNFYYPDELKTIRHHVDSSKSALLMRPKRTPESCHMVCAIYRKDIFLGTTGATDVNTAFTESEIMLTEYIAELLGYAYRTLSGATKSDNLQYYLLRLISGLDIEQRIVDYHLNQLGWSCSDGFYLMCFTFDQDIDTSGCGMGIRRALYAQYQQIITFYYENSVIGILRKSENHLESPDERKKLELFCRNNYLSCGVSNCFYDFMMLKLYYIQGKSALMTIDTAGISLAFFSDCYGKHILHTLDTATSLRSLCHPLILKLFHNNQTNKQELLKTLYEFLINGRNISAAARKLYIHRNTLLYRVEVLSDMIGEKLTDIDDNLALQLLLTCMILNEQCIE